ncbi:hypothetical protein KIN20_031133 [Parelaphostrongylus tenuis]|uniref:Uncharacterized protein n=1 Tax=Parelaphostrongylus tenuis TaxID=148309 RepID=A0AAD5WH27_PARTN|nr:hypothetical protein KIN20_031133 [Parelaphostrongylus tenuis]
MTAQTIAEGAEYHYISEATALLSPLLRYKATKLSSTNSQRDRSGENRVLCSQQQLIDVISTVALIRFDWNEKCANEEARGQRIRRTERSSYSEGCAKHSA